MTALTPDIVCLQEVTARTAQPWTERLTAAGLRDVRVADVAAASGRDRPLLTLVASRWQQEPVVLDGLPWPERVVATRMARLEVVNVHSPISPKPGLAKVLTHEAVHAHLSTAGGPRLICGDLNTPRREHPDGRVWTFARDRYGRLRADRGERWDEAELALIKGLERHGFRDAFRSLHGLERRDPSWVWQRYGGGYRLDHLIVSGEVQALVCGYLHEWRDQGLSDHSPLVAHIRWPGHTQLSPSPVESIRVYRAPMRARDVDLPAGAGAEYGLAHHVVGIGPGRGERARHMISRFAAAPNGAFVWTRDLAGDYHLGRMTGAMREDLSPAALAVGIVYVRDTTWLGRSFSEAEVASAVRRTFARGGRNFQQTHDEEAERRTRAMWQLECG